MRRCRGWMIAGGSVEILKNRIAEHVFDRRFDQRPPKTAAGGGVNLALRGLLDRETGPSPQRGEGWGEGAHVSR